MTYQAGARVDDGAESTGGLSIANGEPVAGDIPEQLLAPSRRRVKLEARDVSSELGAVCAPQAELGASCTTTSHEEREDIGCEGLALRQVEEERRAFGFGTTEQLLRNAHVDP